MGGEPVYRAQTEEVAKRMGRAYSEVGQDGGSEFVEFGVHLKANTAPSSVGSEWWSPKISGASIARQPCGFPTTLLR